MKSKLLIILLSFSLSLNAQSFFQKIIGGNLGDNMVIAEAPNAYYLLHNITTPDYISEILKFDSYGNYQWGKTYFFSFAAANTFRIRYENNALYITGGYQHNGYKNLYAKLDLTGHVTWIKELDYHDVNDNTRLLPFNGGSLLVGHRDYIGTAPDYTYDITLTAMDASGNLLWGKAFGDDTYDFLANSAVITPNNEIMVAGNYGQRSINQYSPMIARFDASGNLLWMKLFSDSTSNYTSFRINDITNTSDGNFIVTGHSLDINSNYDMQLIKFSGQGSVIWAKSPSLNGSNEYGKSVIEDSQHNIVVSGNYFYSGLYGDFLAKFDLSGNFIHATKIEKTLDSPFLYNTVYSGLGGDLLEQPGFGYVNSTVFTTTNFTYKHCLVTTDYNGLISCTQLSNAYPFTNQNSAWTTSNLTPLPSFLTNISSVAINVYDSAKTYQAANLCTLVTNAEQEMQNKLEMSIYPNPTSAKIFVTVNSFNASDLNWKIFDALGREIESAKHEFHNYREVFEIDLKKISKGIYFLHVNDGLKESTQKFIID